MGVDIITGLCIRWSTRLAPWPISRRCTHRCGCEKAILGDAGYKARASVSRMIKAIDWYTVMRPSERKA